MYNSRAPRSPRPPEVQRRESLVKPTWVNVNPGQVSPSTLDATFAAGVGDSAGILCHSPSEANVNNNAITSGKQASLQQRREVELYDIFAKVMLLGDSGVGKTCLLVRFRDGTFLSGNFISTVGIDFRNKIVTVDQVRVKLQIWDTAGQERFRSVTHAYYRDAHALLLLYDVTNKVTFDNTRAWLVEIREYAQEDVVIMLLGNKSDCGAEREVKKEEGERLAREYNVGFLETSAKTGLNVDLAFLAVARQLKSRKSEFAAADDAKFNVQEYVREHAQRPTCPSCI
ncbi:ras-related protein Rab-37 isoform X2 [Phlebotomus argentipes]|nr:ras-related protein Rab-37 isoform X2 [Phlebotomus argentipes]